MADLRDAPRDTLSEFAAVIGEDAALRLAVAFGGRQLYIPKNAPAGSELVEAIGESAATKLAQRWGGVHFAMPLERGKRARIVELSNADELSVGEIARLVGCTERHVYQVRREYQAHGPRSLMSDGQSEEERRQLDMFAAAQSNPNPKE